jgi:CRP-like cAMP-binding protein
MANDELIAMLLGLDIFRNVGSAQAAAIVEAADRVVFRPGQHIVEAGAAGDAAFLLVGGDAVVESDAGDGRPPAALAPGSLIGELAMLVEHTYGVTVTCRSSVRALRLDRGMLRREMEAAPQLAEKMLERVSSRLTRIAVELRRLDETLALVSVRNVGSAATMA